MSRRKRPTLILSTAHHGDVDPTWKMHPHLAVKYRDAVLQLAAWASPSWTDPNSRYFKIREILVDLSERWSIHDWQADQRFMAERAAWARNKARAASAVRRLIEVAQDCPGRDIERAVASYLAGCGVQWPADLNKREIGAETMRGALTHIIDIAESDAFMTRAREPQIWSVQLLGAMHGSGQQCFFGPLVYPSPPTKHPSRDVALGVALADAVSQFHPSRNELPDINFRHNASVSTDLPWTALNLFAAASVGGEAGSDFQKKVAAQLQKCPEIRAPES